MCKYHQGLEAVTGAKGGEWASKTKREWGLPEVPRRTLPEPAQGQIPFPLWGFIKNILAKPGLDLHTVSVPAYLNEPLSGTQRNVESCKSAKLLNEAALLPHQSEERLCYVAAFCVGIHSNMRRTNKPFKDLFGATFDHIDVDNGIRLMVEEVEHRPPKQSLYGEGRGWLCNMTFNPHFSLKLTHLKIDWSNNFVLLEFADGDMYSWTYAPTYYHNLVFGKRYCANRGDWFVKCMGSGLTAQMQFIEPWHNFSLAGHKKMTFQVEGRLETAGGQVIPNWKLYGWWNKELHLISPTGERCIWQVQRPAQQSGRWEFDDLAISLNQLTPELEQLLPVTDARRRPDMQLMEQGYCEQADAWKNQMEARQRREMAAAGKAWSPRWFRLETIENADGRRMGLSKYKGGYWEARETGDWPKDLRDPYAVQSHLD